MELWDLSKKIVFFSAPQSVSNLELVISVFAIDPSKRQDSKFIDGRNTLLGKLIGRTKEKYFLFSIDESNFQILNNKLFSIKFDSFNYSIKALELAKVFRNHYIYGGSLRVLKIPEGIERPAFLNHGAMVSMPGEPAIEKLCLDLINKYDLKEEQYQQALDFVIKFLVYDESDFYFGREFLHRANETLFGKTGDCSNKVILYASLLEQINLPYLLIYSMNHITVAVPKGAFENDNDYNFFYNSTDWTIAETTVKNFKIGKTKIIQDSNFKKFNYIQNPKDKNKFYNFLENKLIMFG